MENKVLAKIGNKEIREQDLEQALATLDPQVAFQFKTDEGKKRLLMDLVNQELLYLDAVENKFNEEELFVAEMKKIEENVLKQYAVNKVVNNIQITDEEKIKFYESNLDKFVKPESISAKHILVADEATAADIAKQLSKNEISFEDAAVKYSTCPSKDMGGDLGTFGKGQMVPEFEEACFKMKKGETSNPVKTQFGYHIIKLEDCQEAAQADYEDVKQDVEKSLVYQKQSEAYSTKMAELTKKHADKVTISE